MTKMAGNGQFRGQANNNVQFVQDQQPERSGLRITTTEGVHLEVDHVDGYKESDLGSAQPMKLHL